MATDGQQEWGSPFYRPWEEEERRKVKIVRRVGWYKLVDCVGFYPVTLLIKKFFSIVEEDV